MRSLTLVLSHSNVAMMDAVVDTMYAYHDTPVSITAMEKRRSLFVVARTSPYPTVVSVENAQ